MVPAGHTAAQKMLSQSKTVVSNGARSVRARLKFVFLVNVEVCLIRARFIIVFLVYIEVKSNRARLKFVFSGSIEVCLISARLRVLAHCAVFQ